MKLFLVATMGGLTAACWLPTESSSGAFPELPEHRGPVLTQLGHAAAASPLAWNADGSALFLFAFAGSGPWTYSIREVQVPSGAARAVIELATQPYDVLPTGTSTVAYTLYATQANRYSLHEVAATGGTSTTIEPTLAPGGWIGDARRVAVGADGALLFVRSPNTLVVRDASGETRVLSTSCGAIFALSPTRDRVLCGNAAGGAYATVAIADGTATPVSVPAGAGTQVMAMHWGASDIQFLFRDWMDLRIASSASGTIRNVYTPGDDDALSFGVGDAVSFSPDGQTIAFWRWECYRSTGFLDCDTQSLLMLLDVATGATRHVAVVKDPPDFTASASRPVFSPDGSRLVYHFRGQVHLISTIP